MLPGGNKVNQIFLIPFIFFVLLTTVNAEQLYNCIDSNGNKLITSCPQDGMKCETGDPNKESSNTQIASENKHKMSENVVEVCSNLYNESKEISDQIRSLEERRSELLNKQNDVRKRSIENRWSRQTELAELRPLTEEQKEINKEMSSLYQKKSKIGDDIRTYSCAQLQRDLSRLNQSSGQSNRSSTVIMRNQSTVILRH